MEWLTTFQIVTNTNTLKPDHYQPCLNIYVQNTITSKFREFMSPAIIVYYLNEKNARKMAKFD